MEIRALQKITAGWPRPAGRRALSALVSAGMAALLLSSCVKDELHNTPHPDKGKIAVTADWTDKGENIPVPEKWTVSLGDYTGEETAATHAPDCLFEPGDYTLAAYNLPEGITISGTTATVAADPNNTGCIAGQPDWLFTSVQDVTIEADTDYDLTAVMRQQVRGLTLVIEPTGDARERIIAVTGTLSGAAGTLDFAMDTHGTPSSVALTFTKITEGTDAGKWAATVRLLGIAGDTQALTAVITYADGNPQDTVLESDLTDVLADFNAGPEEPFTVTGSLSLPVKAGVGGCTITGWQQADSTNIDAH